MIKMAFEIVACRGKQIQDKHTHYELTVYLDSSPSSPATVIIRPDIAKDFQKKYDKPIQECELFAAEVDFGRNDERIKECQYHYLPRDRMIGSIHSIDDVLKVE